MLKAFGSVFGEQHGGTNAPWLMALHGWARSHADFAAVLSGSLGDGVPLTCATTTEAAISHGGTAPTDAVLDAIALDLAGFGATPAPPSAWGSHDYARSIEDILKNMSEKAQSRIVVMGHSFGGRVAVRLAAMHPELVEALVLTGVPLGARQSGDKRRRNRSSPSLRYRSIRWANRRGLVSDTRMDALRYQYGSEDYKRAQGTVRASLVKMVNERYESDLRSLKCPVELVWGSEDTVVPVQIAQEAKTLIDTCALEVRPGVGHMLPLEDPQALRDAVIRRRP